MKFIYQMHAKYLHVNGKTVIRQQIKRAKIKITKSQ